MDKYYCSNGKWINTSKINSNPLDTNTTTIGDNTLLNIVCEDTLTINSQAKNISVFPFDGTKKDFIKKINDTNFNDYWISNDNKDIIIKNMLDLLHYQNNLSTLENAYMCYNNKVVLIKKIKENGIKNWVVLANDYKSLFNLSLNTLNYIGNNKFLSWNYYNNLKSNDYKQFFEISPNINTTQKENNIFYSKFNYNGINNNIINNKIQIGLNKSKFTIFNNNDIYYTIKKNCNNKCFGTNLGNSNYYNGDIIDNMYRWFWDNNLNQFVDAKEITNIYDLYNSGNFALYVNYPGYNKIFYKKEDINGNFCYQSQTGEWITKNLQIIPNQYISNGIPNIPPNKTCKNIFFNTNNIIILNSRTEIINWEKALNNYMAFYDNLVFTKKISGKFGYWENNNELLTKGSRENLPIITNNNKKYLTMILGTNLDKYDSSKTYRYSDFGFKYNKDNNFYQWVNINTIKSINDYIDADCKTNNYAVDVCNLTYNGTKFLYKNNVCAIPLNNSFCPVINNISTKYDWNNHNCFKDVTNADCNVGYTYNKNLNICIQQVCPSDLIYNPNNSRCERRFKCSNNGTYNYTKHQCVSEPRPGEFFYENVNCKQYSKNEDICFLNVNPPNIYNTNLGYISAFNVNLLPGMILDNNTDRMIINLNLPNNSLLSNNIPNTLNIIDFSNINLQYDNLNNTLYYNPNQTLCKNAKFNNMNANNYGFFDGFCYTKIGEQCKISY